MTRKSLPGILRCLKLKSLKFKQKLETFWTAWKQKKNSPLLTSACKKLNFLPKVSQSFRLETFEHSQLILLKAKISERVRERRSEFSLKLRKTIASGIISRMSELQQEANTRLIVNLWPNDQQKPESPNSEIEKRII